MTLANKRIKFNSIIDKTSDFYGIKREDILSKKRKEKIVRARQIIAYILREKFGVSFPTIGKKLGGRDHTTAIHSYNRVKKIIKKNKSLEKEIELICDSVNYKMSSPEIDSIKSDLNKKNTAFLEDEGSKEIKKEKYPVIRSLDDLPKQSLSPEHIKRQLIILNNYKNGLTLEEIGKRFNLSRERVRQIVETGFVNEARELVKEGITLNLKEFLKEKREEHLIALAKKQNRKSVFFNKEEKEKKIKKKRWSRYYDNCRNCGTVVIPHHSHGYCRKCYPKTTLFKEMQEASRLRNIEARKKHEAEYSKKYSRRPEVIVKRKKRENLRFFGGNREKAILRDNERCRNCGLSREENLKRSGKDLSVFHINSKEDNNLENLITLCSECLSSMINSRRKK